MSGKILRVCGGCQATIHCHHQPHNTTSCQDRQLFGPKWGHCYFWPEKNQRLHWINVKKLWLSFGRKKVSFSCLGIRYNCNFYVINREFLCFYQILLSISSLSLKFLRNPYSLGTRHNDNWMGIKWMNDDDDHIGYYCNKILRESEWERERGKKNILTPKKMFRFGDLTLTPIPATSSNEKCNFRLPHRYYENIVIIWKIILKIQWKWKKCSYARKKDLYKLLTMLSWLSNARKSFIRCIRIMKISYINNIWERIILFLISSCQENARFEW